MIVWEYKYGSTFKGPAVGQMKFSQTTAIITTAIHTHIKRHTSRLYSCIVSEKNNFASSWPKHTEYKYLFYHLLLYLF